MNAGIKTGLMALAALAACRAPSPSSPVTNETNVEQDSVKPVFRFPQVSVPRPELDVEQLVPDFHEELRWPLSAMSHPDLAPRFDVASVFAQPGIGYLELCERGVQNRLIAGRNHDELEYLRAWCSAANGDVDAACGRLVPLASSPVAGLAAAIRTDLANILASQGDVADAEHLLGKHNIADVAVLDLLAATYVELGREQDAYVINRRALDSVGRVTTAVQCRRLVRDIVLGPRAVASIKELAALATEGKAPDPVCVQLHHAINCWTAPDTSCADHFRDRGVAAPYEHQYLLAAYRAWPNPGSQYQWTRVGDLAVLAMPLPGAEDMTKRAYHAALDAGPSCNRPLVASLERAQLWVLERRFAEEVTRCAP